MGIVKRLQVLLQQILSKPASHLSILILAGLILVASGFVAAKTEYDSINSRDWLLHAYDVRQQISEFETARAEARAAVFAYLLRPQASEKARLDEQISAARLAVQNIRAMVQDNPFQTE